jgi:hypothetical protein
LVSEAATVRPARVVRALQLEGDPMKHLLFALAALSVLSWSIPASAACPPGTSYNCTTTYNGKQSCGCR